MSEEVFIFDFLLRKIPNDHQIIYLYTHGSYRTSENAINQTITILNEIFYGIYTIEYLKYVTKIFLDLKKELFIKRQIKVKSFY